MKEMKDGGRCGSRLALWDQEWFGRRFCCPLFNSIGLKHDADVGRVSYVIN